MASGKGKKSWLQRYPYHSGAVLLAVLIQFACFRAIHTRTSSSSSRSNIWSNKTSNSNNLLMLSIWMVTINLTTFLMFAVDKFLAVTTTKTGASMRIPELVLHVLTLLGGVAGQRLGMAMFQHKNNRSRHPEFQTIRLLAVAGW
eukprot:CAMPEP_0198154696 /NCGR_PEP_ID=MMETSP1443-20131203/68737_1 /TAXON_ID=186043 /ORGANISM="Entomoneis sp., Strain CCMP2396" /LENGTH=143 /DNA_ID=CAMNT_0043821395 /DNA_START=61 /DNA_END=489 /DNA_ORIENTATION=+